MLVMYYLRNCFLGSCGTEMPGGDYEDWLWGDTDRTAFPAREPTSLHRPRKVVIRFQTETNFRVTCVMKNGRLVPDFVSR